MGNVASSQKKKRELLPYKDTLTSEIEAVLICLMSNPILASSNNMRFGKKQETLFSDLQLFPPFFVLLKILIPVGISIDMFQKPC